MTAPIRFGAFYGISGAPHAVDETIQRIKRQANQASQSIFTYTLNPLEVPETGIGQRFDVIATGDDDPMALISARNHQMLGRLHFDQAVDQYEALPGDQRGFDVKADEPRTGLKALMGKLDEATRFANPWETFKALHFPMPEDFKQVNSVRVLLDEGRFDIMTGEETD